MICKLFCVHNVGIISNVTLNDEELIGWRHVHFEVEETCGRLFQTADLSRERSDLKFVKSLSSASNLRRLTERLSNKAFIDELLLSETSLPQYVPTFYAGELFLVVIIVHYSTCNKISFCIACHYILRLNS